MYAHTTRQELPSPVSCATASEETFKEPVVSSHSDSDFCVVEQASCELYPEMLLASPTWTRSFNQPSVDHYSVCRMVLFLHFF